MQVKNTGLLVRKSWRISRWCQQILSHQTYSKSVAPLFCTSLSFTGWRFAIYLYLYTKKCASIPCLIEMYLRKDSFFVLFCFKSSQKIMMPAPPHPGTCSWYHLEFLNLIIQVASSASLSLPSRVPPNPVNLPHKHSILLTSPTSQRTQGQVSPLP